MMNEQSMNVKENDVKSILEDNQTSEYEESFAKEALNEMSMTEKTGSEDSEQTLNGLENFGMDEESGPDLFSSENEGTETQDLLSTDTKEDNSEDDDLEIPAFLRRQKN